MKQPRMMSLVLLTLVAASSACASDPAPSAGEDADAAVTSSARTPGRASMAGDQGTQEGMTGMAMEPDGRIRLTARQASLAGVRFAVAERAEPRTTVRAVAVVVPDEAGLGVVNARVGGWVERLLVNETGRTVEVGDPLFELYAPDLVNAQEELLLAKRLAGLGGGDTLVAAARRRLSLWGIADGLIEDIEREGRARSTLTIRSPFRGTVIEKRVIEGQFVRAGEPLFEIADLSTVWIEPAVFEQDIGLVAVGQQARITFDAHPGRAYEGRVSFLYPTLDPATRTLRVRIEVPNPDGTIRPMMYGAVALDARRPPGVTVPLTAVLPTGSEDLAFVVRGGGVEPTPVVVGARADSVVTIFEGLTAGDTVVASATFLFDSESNLAAAMAGIMLDMGMGLDMGGMDMGGMDMGGTGAGDMDAGGMEMEGAGNDSTNTEVQPDSAGPSENPSGAEGRP